MEERIKLLIAKYFSDNMSRSEVKELIEWVEKGHNIKLFNDYVSFNYSIEKIGLNPSDNDILWKKIQSSIKHSRRKNNYWTYAAVIIILLSISLSFLFFNKQEQLKETPIIVDSTIKIGTDKATLTLEDGSNIILEQGQNYTTDNLSSNGEELIYNKNKSSNQTNISYNYLTIPRGGQYTITLSDGTQVWLNSESQLKYPVSFIQGNTRNIELIYGEAYFDVSPSILNNGDDFKVTHNKQEVQVLGTEFNIKAYKDEISVYTTLVEGRVSVTNSKHSALLIPEQQSIITNTSDKINVLTVDTYNETSWKDGVFSFERKPLKDIMTVLSRWYDMKVEFLNEDVEQLEVTGVVGSEQNLEVSLA
ncbi:MAG: FecR domain-containing protein [Bacteroidota bacterium]